MLARDEVGITVTPLFLRVRVGCVEGAALRPVVLAFAEEEMDESLRAFVTAVVDCAPEVEFGAALGIVGSGVATTFVWVGAGVGDLVAILLVSEFGSTFNPFV